MPGKHAGLNVQLLSAEPFSFRVEFVIAIPPTSRHPAVPPAAPFRILFLPFVESLYNERLIKRLEEKILRVKYFDI